MTELLAALVRGDVEAVQPVERRRAELLADVAAAATRPDGSVEADLVVTRPTLLRRLVALLAGRVPEGVDRIVTADGAAALLGAALALETGLSLAVVRPGARIAGELHPGERVLAVVVTADADPGPLRTAVEAAGATVRGVLVALEAS